MTKYSYKTIIRKNGDAYRYRCWTENFKDADTGDVVPIKRHRLIKVNGEKVYWNPTRRVNRG